MKAYARVGDGVVVKEPSDDNGDVSVMANDAIGEVGGSVHGMGLTEDNLVSVKQNTFNWFIADDLEPGSNRKCGPKLIAIDSDVVKFSVDSEVENSGENTGHQCPCCTERFCNLLNIVKQLKLNRIQIYLS